jgi:hypothetical protein
MLTTNGIKPGEVPPGSAAIEPLVLTGVCEHEE